MPDAPPPPPDPDEPPAPPDPPPRRYRSAREVYGGDSLGSSLSAALRAPRPRSGTRRVLIAILILAVLIVIASLRHHHLGRVPPGRWGQTIACLQRNSLLSVAGAAASGTAPVGVHTTAVAVADALHHTALATIRHYPSAAAAAAGRSGDALHAPAADYRQDGATLWAWLPGGSPPHLLSNAGERTIIAACVRDPAG